MGVLSKWRCFEREAEVSASGSSLASESTRLRARQNVLYELGYFAGKYWYSRRASTIRRSDLAGVLYAELDEHGGRKRKLLSKGICWDPI
ncbi:TIR domain-containing protein [Morganella morganii]|uniref:TIR domain-containing protein n=1 Tax=Morganella morganii TaxID=582 RepID=UPI001E558D06|nr:TIR domain-containing protein [Morganella morganii]MDS0907407.1 nucleotide-binding protein [Morganella morganii]